MFWCFILFLRATHFTSRTSYLKYLKYIDTLLNSQSVPDALDPCPIPWIGTLSMFTYLFLDWLYDFGYDNASLFVHWLEIYKICPEHEICDSIVWWDLLSFCQNRQLHRFEIWQDSYMLTYGYLWWIHQLMLDDLHYILVGFPIGSRGFLFISLTSELQLSAKRI